MWVGLALILLLTSLIRWRLLSAPLERDEGEYAYAGQLILQGIAPYDQVYNMKMPGIYAAYALIMAVFGQTQQAIHLGLLIVNVVTSVLLFLTGRRLFNPLTGVGAAGAWAVMSLSPSVQGVFANAEHFVVPFALGGILLLLIALDRQKNWLLLIGALLLGTGFMMKQHGAAYILFGGMLLIHHQWRRKPIKGKLFSIRIILFMLGVLAPFLLTCGILAAAGTFGKFWFWTFSYARQYISSVPLSRGFNNYFIPTLVRIAGSGLLISMITVFGPVSLIWNRTARRQWVFACGFAFFGFLAVCPGFYFRPHYFVLLLPAWALWAGIGIDGAGRIFSIYRSAWLAKSLLGLLLAVVLTQSVYKQREFLWEKNPSDASRSIYYPNPFAESLPVADYIKEHTAEDDTVAVIGSEPQIYFYSQRRSATGYIYAYDLVKDHEYAATMREEMIREIETNLPEIIIFVSVNLSWLAQPSADLMNWLRDYTQQHYRRTGTVDIYREPNPSQFRWELLDNNYAPRSNYWLEIYRRKH